MTNSGNVNSAETGPRTQCQMEDAQCYFNFRPIDNQRRRSPATQMEDLLDKPFCSYAFVFWTGTVFILMLIGAVIALGTLADFSCTFCPKNWVMYEDKCFWISEVKQTWNYSQKDCVEKDAQLAVVQEQKDLDLISHINGGTRLVWIGLSATSPAGNWTWVDGSPLNHTLLQVKGESQANSCGMLNGAKVISEACSAVTKWICQRDVIQV